MLKHALVASSVALWLFAAAGCTFPSTTILAPQQVAGPTTNCIAVVTSGSTETINLTTAPGTCTDSTYLAVRGYTTGAGAQVLQLAASSTNNVVFTNADTGTAPHTASNLGQWSGSYPSTFSNPTGTNASQAGTDISSPSFSTGRINNGATSLAYKAAVPGMYMMGCAFHYAAFTMRTVIIVL